MKTASAAFLPPGEGTTPHPQVRQLDALTSLRFLAAMLVVLFHYSTVHFGDAPKTGLSSIGYTGVSFFFMLSGFILAYNYRKVDFSVAQNRYRFYWARAARIYPIYLASLLIAAPFFWVVLVGMKPVVLQYLYGAGGVLAPLGLHSWVPGAACALNCPSWSISTEFFFYLLFPFVFPAIYARPSLWTWICLAAWIAVLAGCTYLWARFGHGLTLMGDLRTDPVAEITSQFVKYFPVVRAPEFLLGILLFVAWERFGSRLSNGALLSAAALAALLLGLTWRQLPEIALHDGLTAIAWAPLILFGANVRSGPLVWPAMMFLGRISFSLYLTHVTVLSAMNSVDKHLLGGLLVSTSPWCLTIASAIAALVVATLSYEFIEDPARRAIMGRSKIPRIDASASRVAPPA
jgi:peptidoglycan/LPS O-acetylase OafA/YrhL